MKYMIDKQELLSRIDYYISLKADRNEHSALFNKGMEEGYRRIRNLVSWFTSAQPDITDAQAIDHLQATGWLKNHDHEMYMMGIRKGLGLPMTAESYDALIQPEHRWIPCKEKQPKEDGAYLVTLIYTDKKGIEHRHTSIQEFKYGIWVIFGSCQTEAWMSLPEPYKEEQDG